MNTMRDVLSVAEAELRVTAKVRAKFDKIEAEAEQAAEHRREIRSWAQVADRAAFRLWTYDARRKWARRAVDAGLCSEDEAHELARLKYPLP